MDSKEIEREKNLEVVFIVPIGVDQGIFPWGVNCIKDYIDKTSEATTHIWDLREDKYFTRAVIDYSDLLSELFLSLKVDQMLRFFSVTFNPYIFFGTVAYAGKDFSELAGNKKLLNGKKVARVKKLQTETEKHIVDRIISFKDQKKDAQRIWAFSVYDATLFNSLYIASLIKKADPESNIIFGGDYFDFECAEELMKSVSFIEGVIVGYGEETIRTIISKKNQGVCISNLKLKGFVNSAYIQAGEGVNNELREVNIPPFYEELTSCAPISYIKQTKPGAFHILTQRGCSWGKCSFCTQIDKRQLYRISNKQLIDELISAIEETKTKHIDITFESEEVSFEFLLDLINRLKSYQDRDIQFVIRLWFQVKSFRKELARELYKIAGDKLTIIFAMNFESLNYDTLKNMHKGHSPVKAIESAKAVIDSGHIFRSNYLEQFPLENGESIQEEISIMKTIVHLFLPPRGEMVFFPYSANNRDELSNNQEKYKIKLTRAAGDNWLKNAFGVDLPFSIWAFQYKNKLSWDLSSLIYHVYNRSVYYTRWGNIPRECIKYFWGSNKLPFSEHFFFLGRKLRSGVWHVLLKLFMGIGLGKSYKVRKNILLYLLNVKRKLNNTKTSFLVIKGNDLIKEYNIPGQEEKWTKSLTSTELRILRYLYWTRKICDVVSTFQNEMSERDIKQFIYNHIEVGVIVRFRDTILCTANDPEYWTSNEYMLDIPWEEHTQ